MSKAPIVKSEAEVEKYPNGDVIARYPKWIYPGGPKHSSPDRKDHNGALVNSKEEHEQYVKDHPEFGEKVAEGWDK